MAGQHVAARVARDDVKGYDHNEEGQPGQCGAPRAFAALHRSLCLRQGIFLEFGVRHLFITLVRLLVLCHVLLACGHVLLQCLLLLGIRAGVSLLLVVVDIDRCALYQGLVVRQLVEFVLVGRCVEVVYVAALGQFGVGQRRVLRSPLLHAFHVCLGFLRPFLVLGVEVVHNAGCNDRTQYDLPAPGAVALKRPRHHFTQPVVPFAKIGVVGIIGHFDRLVQQTFHLARFGQRHGIDVFHIGLAGLPLRLLDL